MQRSTIGGKWLIIISVIVGICHVLSRYSAVLSLLCMIVSALLVAFSFFSVTLGLFQPNRALLKGRAAALLILLFPIITIVVNGRFHLMDRAYVLLSDGCPLDGVSVGGGHIMSACRVRDLEGWAQIEAVIYDSSDQVALPRGSQSPSWWAAASKLRLPFDQLEFRSVSLGSHYYSVGFDENRPNFTKSK